MKRLVRQQLIIRHHSFLSIYLCIFYGAKLCKPVYVPSKNQCFFSAAEVLVNEVPAVPSYISDRYKVGRMLGDGNFAVVRECTEHSTGREYALKIINKGKCRGKVNKHPPNTTQKRQKLYRHVKKAKAPHNPNFRG